MGIQKDEQAPIDGQLCSLAPDIAFVNNGWNAGMDRVKNPEKGIKTRVLKYLKSLMAK